MRFIDFFAGVGGFRLGMEMAGHECVGFCEIDKYAVKSYRAMHIVKEGEWHAADIRTVEPWELPDADCWCGGFPCQSFSIAGKRGGFEDTRGTLLFEILRLAAVRKPQYLFFENVKGLLSHNGGETFGIILKALGELGYDAEYQVLNSKNYGVPQNRERVFIIGHLGGFCGGKVFPVTESNSKALEQITGGSQAERVYSPEGISCTLAGEAGGLGGKTGLYLINKKDENITFRNECNCIDANYYKGLDAHQGRTGILDIRAVLTPDRKEKGQNGRIVKEIGEPMFTLTSQDRHGVMLVDNQGRKGKDLKPLGTCPALRAEAHGNEPRIIDCRHPKDDKRVYKDGICPTIMGSDHKQMKSVLLGARIRRLTPKECFRLQGFPDEYFERARAVNSDTQLYKQAGNSVTVNVIYEIATRLKDAS